MARRKSTTPRPIPATGKHFHYDPTTGDFALYLDGQLVGFKADPQAAENELDRLEYERLSRAA